MKKIFLALILLTLVNTCYSQTPVLPNQETPKGTKEYYLHKSKANKTRGLILTAGGALLIGTAFYIAVDESLESLGTLGQDEYDNTIPDILAYTGLGAVIGGTISLISASHKKKKARSLAIIQQQVPLPLQGTSMTKAVPTVGIKFHF
ncbi:hypothetical protein [Rufibacter tibetensis]|uniref:DUF4134 domain-containing protein n=1 Tax=Rufibacter tibetensis TaxID=512763 RepID=A0A0P0CWB8_9BACT|nr:hypothetical protein [Rufibacter tibetensis]ALI98662.1 hypothetical protein DC20_06390 [Rufibacter tibetensis]